MPDTVMVLGFILLTCYRHKFWTQV